MKDFAKLDDYDIQNEIVEIIKRKQIELSDDSLHNYKDLKEMNFQVFLTTNYENLIYEHLRCKNIPILLKDINFNTQDLFDEQRIFHLHGTMSNPGTIVISKKSYDELYKNEKYENLLKAVTSSKKLLFLGFSFDDQFIKLLISDHKQFFKGEHYIILDNPSDDKIRELKEFYGLRTIKYDSNKIPHQEAIREILNYIKDVESNAKEKKSLETKDKQLPIIGVQVNDLERNLEENLFYQKLKINENNKSKIFDVLNKKYKEYMKRYKYDVNNTYIDINNYITYHDGASIFEHESGGLLECMQISFLCAIIASKDEGYAQGHPGFLLMDTISKYIGTVMSEENSDEDIKGKIDDPEIYEEIYKIFTELSDKYQFIIVENTPPVKYNKYAKYTFLAGEEGLINLNLNELKFEE